MTLTKGQVRNSFEVTCDYGRSKACVGELIAEDCSFQEALEAIRKDGWQIFKNSLQEYEHHCSACVKHKQEAAFHQLRKQAQDG